MYEGAAHGNAQIKENVHYNVFTCFLYFLYLDVSNTRGGLLELCCDNLQS
jgi:hypothetical protein